MMTEHLSRATSLLVLVMSTSCWGQSNDTTMCELDSAIGPLSPPTRRAAAFAIRSDAAQAEFETRHMCHSDNGDEEKYPSFIGNFHKTLPHNEYGEVDTQAYEALLECLSTGDFDKCDDVPGGPTALANPLGGLTFVMRGPDPQAIAMRPPPTLESAQLAAQMAEVYWMALLRDVPFSQYGTNELAQEAADNLAQMPGYFGYGRPLNSDGSVDPANHLFRTSFPGVTEGPHLSQCLLKNFNLDGIDIPPMVRTHLPGVDFMTDYQDWLDIQNGASAEDHELDATPRFLRNARGISQVVATDTNFSEFFRCALIALKEKAVPGGSVGPYSESSRQSGFTTFGPGHFMEVVGSAHSSTRQAWYQKWNVNRFLRPEAMAGLVHNDILEGRNSPIDKSLLNNELLKTKLKEHNYNNNELLGADDPQATLLLPMGVPAGSPTHPSYPAGHSVNSGAAATVLKAFLGPDGKECVDSPVEASDDGLERFPLLEEGGEPSCLTWTGEVNKLASNVAMGRSMLGVHFRADNVDGMLFGELIAIRILQEELSGLPEGDLAFWEFDLFNGDTIKIERDGNTIAGVFFPGPYEPDLLPEEECKGKECKDREVERTNKLYNRSY